MGFRFQVEFLTAMTCHGLARGGKWFPILHRNCGRGNRRAWI